MPGLPPRSTPFWDPDKHAGRRPLLLARARIVAALRGWFAAQDFIEVETGALAASPGNETHLAAFATVLKDPAGKAAPLYLRTSPEFACKKLLAAGETRIVEFAKAFRNAERGALHHPEFTLVEWYRARQGYRTLMDDCAAILALAATAANTTRFSFRGHSADAFAAPERLTVAEAFSRFAGIDLLATLPGGEPDQDRLAAAARAAGLDSAGLGSASDGSAGDDDWGDLFSKILVERIEPHLGIGRATILDEYPAVLSALARPAADRRVAERFELYVCGVELANGFGELNDAAMQRRRLAEEMDEKERRYGERYPIDEDFIAALAQMPDACGIALGLDRLVMLATGAARIDQVLWTPLAEVPE